MLVEAQLGPQPFYQREQAEVRPFRRPPASTLSRYTPFRPTQYEADVSCKKAGFLATWGVGRTQPAVSRLILPSMFAYYPRSLAPLSHVQGWQDASVLSPELEGVQMPSIEKEPLEKNSRRCYTTR
jgi:hypothetical protein